MALVGYRDWQRVQYASGLNILSINQLITGVTNSAIFNVQNWNEIIVNIIVPIGQRMEVQINWYADGLGATLLSTVTAGFPATASASWPVAVVGPFFKLILIPDTGAAQFSTQVSVYASLPTHTPAQLNQNTQMPQRLVEVLTANAGIAVGLTSWIVGRALLNATVSGGGSATIELDWFDFDTLTFLRYYDFNVPASGALAQNTVVFPPYPVSVFFSNGPVAQTIELDIMPYWG